MSTLAARASTIGGGRSLREHAADARLLFGFAVNVDTLRTNEAYRRVVQEQCTVITAQKAMRWDVLSRAPRDYDFDSADELIAFADRSRLKLRGHALCWHAAMPQWFTQTATPQTARNLLVDHIRTVAGRYAGRMHSWDVVQDAMEVRDGRPDGLRNSPWMQLVGTGYIEQAFRTARDTDPTALLTYNEFGLETETREAAEKRAAVLLMLRRLKQRNVPIDAVGIQSHLLTGQAYGHGLLEFMNACNEMELQVFLSELDVNDRDVQGNSDRAVANEYGRYLGTALSASNVTTVVTWGVGDGDTWIRSSAVGRAGARPLLFDDRMQPTQAFAAVRSAFDGRNQRYFQRISPGPTQNRPNSTLPQL